MVVALIATSVTLAPRADAALDGSKPPITLPTPAGPTPPPTAAIVDTVEPITTCTGWELRSLYGGHWTTTATWWEYRCEGGSWDRWADHYYWDGARSVHYGQWWEYVAWDEVLLSDCYWWDEAAHDWFGPYPCDQLDPGSDPPPPNQPPVASFTHSCDGLSCRFDGYSSTDPEGRPLTFDWRIGTFAQIGGGTNGLAAWTFSASGSYLVSLTVTDDRGASATASRTIVVEGSPPPPNAPPTVSFTHSCLALTCRFVATASDSDGTVVGYQWDFGNTYGASTADAAVEHTYYQAGTYTVVVWAIDNGGARGSSAPRSVTATNAAPTARFTVQCAALACTFDGTASSDPDTGIDSYWWSFGDGPHQGVGATQAHTYAAAGRYTVTLTIIDVGGINARATGELNVSATGTVSLTGSSDPTLSNALEIVLSASTSKSAGTRSVVLTWTGPSAGTYDVYRDGARIASVDGLSYTDPLARAASGSLVYRVCTAAAACSNEVTVRL